MCRDGEEPLPDDEYVIDGWSDSGVTATVTEDGATVEYSEKDGTLYVSISLEPRCGDASPDEDGGEE